MAYVRQVEPDEATGVVAEMYEDIEHTFRGRVPHVLKVLTNVGIPYPQPISFREQGRLPSQRAEGVGPEAYP